LTPRRLLLALISLAACLGSFGLASAADAQQPASPRRIGVLLGGFSPESNEAQQFRQGLRDAGYVEVRDVVIAWPSAYGGFDLAIDGLQPAPVSRLHAWVPASGASIACG
jgi:hypothetical protein